MIDANVCVSRIQLSRALSRFGTSFAIVNPKLIIEVAVRTQAISVRSWASRVRSTASSVDSDTLGGNVAAVDRDSAGGALPVTTASELPYALGGNFSNILCTASWIFASFSFGSPETVSVALPRHSILLVFPSTTSTMSVPMVTGVTVVDVVQPPQHEYGPPLWNDWTSTDLSVAA